MLEWMWLVSAGVLALVALVIWLNVNRLHYHEDKGWIMDQLDPTYLPRTLVLSPLDQGLPSVAQSIRSGLGPDIYLKDVDCNGGGRNVHRLQNTDEEVWPLLQRYRHSRRLVAQQAVPGSEYCISVYRFSGPYRLLSLVEKETHSVSIQRDRLRVIELGPLETERLLAHVNRALRNCRSAVSACRLDVMSRGLHDLLGGNFRVIEVNGISGYDLRMSDEGQAWPRRLVHICRWVLLRLAIGCYRSLAEPDSWYNLRALSLMPRRARDSVRCGNWEYLISNSPL